MGHGLLPGAPWACDDDPPPKKGKSAFRGPPFLLEFLGAEFLSLLLPGGVFIFPSLSSLFFFLSPSPSVSCLLSICRVGDLRNRVLKTRKGASFGRAAGVRAAPVSSWRGFSCWRERLWKSPRRALLGSCTNSASRACGTAPLKTFPELGDSVYPRGYRARVAISSRAASSREHH